MSKAIEKIVNFYWNPYKELQLEIIEIFGMPYVERKRRELCSKCRLGCDWMIPVTKNGNDCPYYEQK